MIDLYASLNASRPLCGVIMRTGRALSRSWESAGDSAFGGTVMEWDKGIEFAFLYDQRSSSVKQRRRTVAERFGRDAEFVEHRNIEVAQGS